MSIRTYRAVIVGECNLTGPEHAHLSDYEIMAEAIAEAHRQGIIGDEDHQIRVEDLSIGEWSEVQS